MAAAEVGQTVSSQTRPDLQLRMWGGVECREDQWVSDVERSDKRGKALGRYKKRASGNAPLEQVASEQAKAL
jgi:hypothetical protein